MLKEKLIIGLGVTGLSCADFYHKKNIPFKIFDTRSKSFHTKKNNDTRLEGYSIVYEKYDSDYLDNVEQVIISPGLDRSNVIFREIKKRNISISTDIDIFKEYSNTPIISITGTNGKTTVVTMLEHVLKSMRLKSVACGNNGIPPLSIIDQKYDFIILELSSYQLEYMNNFTSYIGLITNIDYDHIERHKSMSDYFNIKLKIFGNVKHSLINNKLFSQLNLNDIRSFGLTEYSKIQINGAIKNDLSYSENKLSYKDQVLNFKGLHNLENILSVLSVTNILHLNFLEVFKYIKNFHYLPHRIELIKSYNNINWYNDSKSTNCASTLAALQYVDEKIILILGGSHKNMNYIALKDMLLRKVKLIIFIGENKNYIKEQLDIKIKTIEAQNMKDVVEIAKNNVIPYDNVLLSPASPSFDMFDNYVDRGNAFKKAVNDFVK